MRQCEIEEAINEELNYYAQYLEDCMHDNKPFDYLNLVAEKYDKDINKVYNMALDGFSYLLNNNVNEHDAKVFSIYKTHQNILREVIK